jgi:uncharacterized protein (DUF2147 family)
MRATLFLAATLLATSFTAAQAAEPIVGMWKTASGATAEIAACGSSYCVTLKSGKHNGKQIGKMAGTGDNYKGEITDPETDKTYSGSGTISGKSLKMKGCMMTVFCKTQTWARL